MTRSRQEQKKPPEQGTSSRGNARLVSPAAQVALCAPEMDGGSLQGQAASITGDDPSVSLRTGNRWNSDPDRVGQSVRCKTPSRDKSARPAILLSSTSAASRITSPPVSPTPTDLRVLSPQHLTICNAAGCTASKPLAPRATRVSGQFASEMDGGGVDGHPRVQRARPGDKPRGKRLPARERRTRSKVVDRHTGSLRTSLSRSWGTGSRYRFRPAILLSGDVSRLWSRGRQRGSVCCVESTGPVCSNRALDLLTWGAAGDTDSGARQTPRSADGPAGLPIRRRESAA